ncbi:MAG: hypothetical protein OEZ04_07210, partial [Nitrospinota bacterium]|nr:hypothetical protein [Nitrospinota bacterium]
MKEAFTKKGYWWIPEKPDNKLSGELSVSDSGAIALEVIGTFYDNPLTDYVPIILGTSEERKLISLVECHMKLPGFGNDEVIPSYMFQGIHVANRDELIFSKTIISVDGLYAWLPQVSPKFSRQTEMNITSSLSLELAFPKIESFEIDSSHRISFGYEHSGPRLGHGIKKYEFDLNAYLLIDHSEPTSWTDIEILLYRINIFFCFGLGEPQALSYVKVLPKGIDNNEYVDVFYPSFPHAEEPKLDHPIYHTLKHSKVENDLSSLLSKWLHYCDKYHYAFRLFFEATTSTRHYLENQFILLTQCLEAF